MGYRHQCGTGDENERTPSSLGHSRHRREGWGSRIDQRHHYGILRGSWEHLAGVGDVREGMSTSARHLRSTSNHKNPNSPD